MAAEVPHDDGHPGQGRGERELPDPQRIIKCIFQVETRHFLNKYR